MKSTKEADKDKDKWYPGKFIKEHRATVKADKAAAKIASGGRSTSNKQGDNQHPSSFDPSTGDGGSGSTRRGYGPDRSVGQVSVTVVDARYIAAAKPILEVQLNIAGLSIV